MPLEPLLYLGKFHSSSKETIYSINNQIKATEVMLIDANGKKQGIMQIEKALDKANKDNLDLVQVSPNDSDPIVCKLLDYGKYIFDKKKISQTLNQR